MEKRIVTTDVLLTMGKYEDKFDKEIDYILNEVYYNSIDMGETRLKRVLVKTEKRYIDYLHENNFIKYLDIHNEGKWSIQLERKGYEVFEKYNGWIDYKKKVIDKISKIENAKSMAIRFWWIPILISVLSLIIAFIALLN